MLLEAIAGLDARTVVLVEGVSDQAAVETLAVRRGRDLAAEGVRVLPMGGVTNVGHYLDRLGPAGRGLRLAGLYDHAEEGFVRRGLERAGLGAELSRDAMAGLGFHVCVADLEDELIRAVGVDGVQEVLAAQGELRSFRLFQRQPAQQERALPAQLRRFLGTRSGRKSAYARLLVEALDLDRVPRSLDGVLAGV
ncbi:TOPRIM nucleotidyl transferase/hydrolase domain-containing protein [Micromonospora sp. WMMD812]|uniref:TOPRIM nucleotidyl transferase/hydrolase domain-containing protein n=1 Tax=Micromonospora sp. WMMD812 TaxID=3015152 RepID=UPI00248C876E|nr:TOPRIM nucleotidyl transferase/hydrolase domain-containing protein [Micromonospora sp. WMMD812]WBB68102.1 ATP-dependent endonuclease [Micromonospora sp. WMMD812]